MMWTLLQTGRQGPWKSHSLCRGGFWTPTDNRVCVLAGDPRFLGVHQGPGQRPLHPKRRIPRPQTWRYVVSVCSALAAGWSTSCLTLFLGCEHFLSRLIFSLTSGNVGGLSSKGGGCSNTPSVLTGWEKLLTKFSSPSIFSGQLGWGDDSTGWLLSWICLKSRRLCFKSPNKLWIVWIFIQSICLGK